MKKHKVLTTCIALLMLIIFLEFLFIQKSLFHLVPGIGILFHLMGGALTVVAAFYLFREWLLKLPLLCIFVFLMGVASLAATGWEEFEWLLGCLQGRSVQGSVDNTMMDLCMGQLGGALASTGLYIAEQKG